MHADSRLQPRESSFQDKPSPLAIFCANKNHINNNVFDFLSIVFSLTVLLYSNLLDKRSTLLRFLLAQVLARVTHRVNDLPPPPPPPSTLSSFPFPSPFLPPPPPPLPFSPTSLRRPGGKGFPTLPISCALSYITHVAGQFLAKSCSVVCMGTDGQAGISSAGLGFVRI